MKYENLCFDGERALYGLYNVKVVNCTFDGPADGESALKECSDIMVAHCDFKLRYPLWHVKNADITDCRMTDTCRAALWYDEGMKISKSVLGGIKALRECRECELNDCEIISTEFGWKCRGISLENCKLTSEYVFLDTKDLKLENVELKGKYSFQYAEDVVVENSVLDTKDAFWHAKNVTVKNSVVKGEYLAWYAENIRFINCKIIGTQPLCYVKGLILENCEMLNTDLAFEYSDVRADITGHVISVKNPVSGYINAESIGEIIIDENQKPDADCVINCRA